MEQVYLGAREKAAASREMDSWLRRTDGLASYKDGLTRKLWQGLLNHCEFKGEHSLRVAFYAVAMCQYMERDQETIDLAIHAGLLHDIGCLVIPEKILLMRREGMAPAQEFALLEHVHIGVRILHRSKLYAVAQAIAYHHAYNPKRRHNLMNNATRMLLMEGLDYIDPEDSERSEALRETISVADAFAAATEKRPFNDQEPPNGDRPFREKEELEDDLIEHFSGDSELVKTLFSLCKHW